MNAFLFEQTLLVSGWFITQVIYLFIVKVQQQQQYYVKYLSLVI